MVKQNSGHGTPEPPKLRTFIRWMWRFICSAIVIVAAYFILLWSCSKIEPNYEIKVGNYLSIISIIASSIFSFLLFKNGIKSNNIASQVANITVESNNISNRLAGIADESNRISTNLAEIALQQKEINQQVAENNENWKREQYKEQKRKALNKLSDDIKVIVKHYKNNYNSDLPTISIYPDGEDYSQFYPDEDDDNLRKNVKKAISKLKEIRRKQLENAAQNNTALNEINALIKSFVELFFCTDDIDDDDPIFDCPAKGFENFFMFLKNNN